MRYFFQVHDAAPIPDDEGMELRDDPAAQSQGLHLAGEILRESTMESIGVDWSLEVTDASGRMVLRIAVAVTAPATTRGLRVITSETPGYR